MSRSLIEATHELPSIVFGFIERRLKGAVAGAISEQFVETSRVTRPGVINSLQNIVIVAFEEVQNR